MYAYHIHDLSAWNKPLIDTCQYCSTSRANQVLRLLVNLGFQNRGVCLLAFPSFPSPSFIFWLSLHFSHGQNRFLGLSLLQNQTEMLATQPENSMMKTSRCFLAFQRGDEDQLPANSTTSKKDLKRPQSQTCVHNEQRAAEASHDDAQYQKKLTFKSQNNPVQEYGSGVMGISPRSHQEAGADWGGVIKNLNLSRYFSKYPSCTDKSQMVAHLSTTTLTDVMERKGFKKCNEVWAWNLHVWPRCPLRVLKHRQTFPRPNVARTGTINTPWL